MSKKFNLRSSAGFTLVELMVVVAIIAILAVIGITIFSGAQRGSRDARRRSDIESIMKAMEANLKQMNVDCPNGDTPPTGTYCAPVPEMFAADAEPEDPSTGNEYIWDPSKPTSGATDYRVCADLEADGTFDGTNQDFCLRNQQ